MNATILKRLFRSISDGNLKATRQIALTIINDENKKGHTQLAKQLQQIIDEQPEEDISSNLVSIPKQSKSIEKNLIELPTSRRYNQPLAIEIPKDALQHHMVLPPETEARFQRIEKEYVARGRLAKYNLKPRKKILLYGAPGCGKTMGAERIAWNVGLPVMKVRFDAMISSYFGESAANLRTVFEASHSKPCLLLLDECDFIAKSRANNQDVGEAPRIVNTLLQLLDEYDAPGLVIATTNLEGSLDNAIFRRFDDVFEIPRPGRQQIDQLLKMTLSSMRTDTKVDWLTMVNKLEGAAAATVVTCAQNAAKNCILSGEEVITHSHLEKAILEVRMF